MYRPCYLILLPPLFVFSMFFPLGCLRATLVFFVPTVPLFYLAISSRDALASCSCGSVSITPPDSKLCVLPQLIILDELDWDEVPYCTISLGWLFLASGKTNCLFNVLFVTSDRKSDVELLCSRERAALNSDLFLLKLTRPTSLFLNLMTRSVISCCHMGF